MRSGENGNCGAVRPRVPLMAPGGPHNIGLVASDAPHGLVKVVFS